MADISKIALPSGDTYDLKDSNALHSISGTSPISVSGSAISHANSGVTAASKGDTTDQTPTWGGTFKVPSGTVNATGHLTAFAEHTVTIPSSLASASANGLMSSEQFSKLSDLPSGNDITSAQLVDIITGTIATKTGAKSGEKAVEVSVNIAPEFSKYDSFSATSPRILSGITAADVHSSGKNLFDKSNYLQSTVGFSGNSTSTPSTLSTLGSKCAWYPLPGGVTYLITCPSRNSQRFAVFSSSAYPTVGGPMTKCVRDNSAESITFAAPAGTKWIGLQLILSSGDVTNIDTAVSQLQIEIASSATTYSAFSGSHTTVTFPAGAGTVYGATLNMTAGVLTVTHAIKTFDGSETWELVDSGDYPYFRSSLSVSPFGSSDYGWSSHFDYKIIRGANDLIGIGTVISGTPYVAARPGDSVATTAAEMKSWCAAQNTAGTPLQVVFPLLRPTDYPITATSYTMAEGTNHFWSSANGTTTVKCVSTVGWGFADAILASISSAQGVSF